MTYTYDNGYPPCYDHDGHPEPVLDQTLPGITGTDPTNEAIHHGHAVVGWRAACACQWKGQHVHLRADHPVSDKNAHLAPDEISDVPGPIEREWAHHVQTAVPEVKLHELHDRGASPQALAAEVQMLRARRIPWKDIAAATATTEQQALARWGHLDLHQRERSGADTRPDRSAFQGPLAELEALAAPNSVHATPDPAVKAAEIAAQGLAGLLAGGTPEMVDEAVERLERALAYAYRARSNLTGGIEVVSVRDWDKTMGASEGGALIDSLTAHSHSSHHHASHNVQVTRGHDPDGAPLFQISDDHTTTRITDPELQQRLDYAHRTLAEAVDPLLLPDKDPWVGEGAE